MTSLFKFGSSYFHCFLRHLHSTPIPFPHSFFILISLILSLSLSLSLTLHITLSLSLHITLLPHHSPSWVKFLPSKQERSEVLKEDHFLLQSTSQSLELENQSHLLSFFPSFLVNSSFQQLFFLLSIFLPSHSISLPQTLILSFYSLLYNGIHTLTFIHSTSS